MNEANKILIVDDEKKIVEVVKAYLEKSNFKVCEAYSGRQALERFEKLNPSLVVLDLMLPDISGEEVCKALRRVSRVPIIMLTAKIEEGHILRGLEIGADDYITKPFSPKELVARVIALLRRTSKDDIPLANILTFKDEELVVNSLSHEVKKDGNIVNLTPNEYKLLIAMINYPKKVFTREELVESVFGLEYEGFDRTIDTHIKNLRRKIETNIKEPKYILTVRGSGYRFGGD